MSVDPREYDKMMIPILIKRLESSDLELRRSASTALMGCGDPQVFEPLVEVLQDTSEDASVRCNAARGLGYLGDKRAREPLNKVANSQSNDRIVRSAAIEALARLGDTRVVDALIKTLRNENEDEDERYRVALTLGEFGDMQTLSRLISIIRDETEDSYVRAELAGALRSPEAIEPLLSLLEDTENEQVRSMVIQALRHFNDQRALLALKQRRENSLQSNVESISSASNQAELDKRIVLLSLYADYRQFYLSDSETQGPSNFWTPQSDLDALAVEPGIIGVSTARYAFVPVEIELCHSQPVNDLAKWDHVVDCSIEIPSGKLVVDGCTAFGDDSPYILVDPGCYQVRVYYGGLESAAWDDPDGEDYYKIALWPGQPTEAKVIKRYWHPKADQYKLVKGKDRGW